MSDKNKSNLLVGIQFLLLVVIIGVPLPRFGEDFPDWVVGVGSLLVWVGLIILALSIFKLGGSLTASPIPKNDSVLKTDGLYKWMRHPIYSGLIATGLGLAIESESLLNLLVAVALIVLLNYKAKWEESFLLERYPEYRTYMSKTGRFVPRLNR
jgi:protein-S-isoprenylcysteine O-methyltransferase Ste14